MDRSVVVSLCVLFSLFFGGCSPKPKEEALSLSTSNVLVAVDTLIYPVAGAVSCSIVNDSILVAAHKQRADSAIFTVYNIRTNKLVREILYGQDEDRCLGIIYAASAEGVLLHDFVKERFALITPERLGDNSELSFHKTNIHAQCILAAKQNRLLFLNPDSFENRKRRLLFSDKECNYMQRNTPSVDTYNVVDGFLLSNKDASRIFYIDKHSGRIELYDDRLSQIKVWDVPDAPTPDYTIYKSGKHKICAFKGSIPFTFIAGSVDKSGIALVYDPCYLSVDKGFVYGDTPAYLMMFSWEGNVKTISLINAGQHPDQCHVLSEGKVSLLFCEEHVIKEVVYECAS